MPRARSRRWGDKYRFDSKISSACVTTLTQAVFVEPPAFHNHGEVLALLLKHAEAFEGIAVHNEQIGEGAGFQTSKLANLAHDLGSDQRGGADDLDRLLHLRPDSELAGLLALQLPKRSLRRRSIVRTPALARVPRLARDAGTGQSAVLTARPAGRSPPTIVSAHVGGNT